MVWQITYASHKKVWWRCSSGHYWQCEVKDRTEKMSGCPYCSGRKSLSGINDLATLCPELAAQWHWEKNDGLSPEQFKPCSEKKVWWKCEAGHEWQAVIENRAVKGNKCPYCSGRKVLPGYNDLATLYPELMKEWHPTLNKDINPEKLRPGARLRVWWQCVHGHEWQAYLFSRTSKKRPGCPYCAGRKKIQAEPHR